MAPADTLCFYTERNFDPRPSIAPPLCCRQTRHCCSHTHSARTIVEPLLGAGPEMPQLVQNLFKDTHTQTFISRVRCRCHPSETAAVCCMLSTRESGMLSSSLHFVLPHRPVPEATTLASTLSVMFLCSPPSGFYRAKGHIMYPSTRGVRAAVFALCSNLPFLNKQEQATLLASCCVQRDRHGSWLVGKRTGETRESRRPFATTMVLCFRHQPESTDPAKKKALPLPCLWAGPHSGFQRNPKNKPKNTTG